MQAIEITTNAHLICITIERTALNTSALEHIERALRGFMDESVSVSPQFSMTAQELRRLPLVERDRILAIQTEYALEDFELIGGGEELSESEII